MEAFGGARVLLQGCSKLNELSLSLPPLISVHLNKAFCLRWWWHTGDEFHIGPLRSVLHHYYHHAAVLYMLLILQDYTITTVWTLRTLWACHNMQVLSPFQVRVLLRCVHKQSKQADLRRQGWYEYHVNFWLHKQPNGAAKSFKCYSFPRQHKGESSSFPQMTMWITAATRGE